MKKRYWKIFMKFAGWPIIIGALSGLAFLAIFSLDNHYKVARINYQAEIDATMYMGRMNAYMTTCTRLDISPQSCIGAWAQGGGN